ncbi:MAG: dephospho-CoA kinase [Bryobacteraceae bacterium]
MLKVGLTGGYASGKSLVAHELERLGCHLIYADDLGHAVLLPGGEAYAAVVQAFGSEILSPDGAIDRKKLAATVFASPELLNQLSGFVHPAVFRLEKQLLDGFESKDPTGIAVIEAAILIETGRYTAFDRLILTACDEETQVARGIKRDHLTREEVLARLAKQMPLEEKKRYAHYIIDTGGEKEQTISQIHQIYAQLKRFAQARQA